MKRNVIQQSVGFESAVKETVKKFAGLVFSLLVLPGLVWAQYTGAPLTPSATPSNLPVTQGAAPGTGVMQSTTPNSVNTRFPQGGQPAAGVVPGQPMPLLNPYQPLQQQTREFNGPVQYGQNTPASPEKPFANYQAKPVISPYMNFYRRGNGSGIDNYNFYVKPALEQEQRQQQVQQQINTIQQNQNQTQVQQQVQFNTNVGASTVGASYGQMNTGMNANRPGASYGFAGAGPTVHVNPANGEKTDKEKIDEKAKKAEEEKEQEVGSYFNPYSPTASGALRPHYEPAKRK